ncbi:LigA protein [Streptomyces himastatinicus ATCC 53653]|uniref:LigA protein n=1 Tax=Streptomyces himastatinicus ATCC 53653 TaxID=457427 RepID=D9WS36_9ACTN|nr:LigA protein [Streptomyces himastatinicus ATCC 53653]
MNISENTVAYVGSRTTPARNGQGKGIEVYDIGPGAPDADRWTLLQTVELDNPTFLAVDHTRRYLYAVHGDLSHVSAFRIEPGTGRLGDLGSQETGGRNPAHLAVDPSNRFLVVANHSSGSVASLPLREDGRLGPVTDLLLLPGEPGPHRAEQTGAKPHHVPFAPDGRFLAVPGKGLDRVFTLALDATPGKLSPIGGTPSGVRWRAYRPCPVRRLRQSGTAVAVRSRSARRAVRLRLQPWRRRGQHPWGPGARHHRRLRRLGGGRNAAARGVAVHRGHPPAVLLLRSGRPAALRRQRAQPHHHHVRRGRGQRGAPSVGWGAGHGIARVHRVLAAAERSVRDPRRGTPRMKCPRPPHEERRG